MNIFDPQFFGMLNEIGAMFDSLGIEKIEEPCIGEHSWTSDCGVPPVIYHCFYCGIRKDD